MSKLQLLIANSQGKVKTETLNGKEYLVAPVSMIVPGVLPGSEGNALYTKSRINERVNRWNQMPLVVNHPKNSSGEYISARDPKILNNQGIGFVFNVKGGKTLSGEAWFDVEKSNEVDPRIIEKLEANENIELSTGSFVKASKRSGKYKGKKYTHVVNSFDPDHLAILLDDEGACSLEDGCGVLVNENGETKELTVNKISHNDIRVRLADAIKKFLTKGQPDTYPNIDLWVREVFDKSVVYEKNGVAYELSYTKKGDKVKVSGEPVEVVSKISYEPVVNTNNSTCVGSRLNINSILHSSNHRGICPCRSRTQ